MEFLVCYDLRGEDHDYPLIWEELERLEGERILESTWIVNTDFSTVESSASYLQQFVSGDDRLVVVSLEDGSWIGFNLLNDT